jgi:hypothetical protein
MATTEVGNENERLQQVKAGTATMERESEQVIRLVGLVWWPD